MGLACLLAPSRESSLVVFVTGLRSFSAWYCSPPSPNARRKFTGHLFSSIDPKLEQRCPGCVFSSLMQEPHVLPQRNPRGIHRRTHHENPRLEEDQHIMALSRTAGHFDARRWNHVNYLLNHRPPAATAADMQAAIWTFCSRTPPLPPARANFSMVLEIISETRKFGAEFVPGPGQKVAVLVSACPEVKVPGLARCDTPLLVFFEMRLRPADCHPRRRRRNLRSPPLLGQS
jgi:hypothetical protein